MTRYLQTKRTFTTTYEETVQKPLDEADDVITEVLISINFSRHNKTGVSKELLAHIVDSATTNLSSYKIFHSPVGLTITGRY